MFVSFRRLEKRQSSRRPPPPQHNPDEVNNNSSHFVMSAPIAALQKQTLRKAQTRPNDYSHAPTRTADNAYTNSGFFGDDAPNQSTNFEQRTIRPDNARITEEPPKQTADLNSLDKKAKKKKKSKRKKVIDFPRTSTKKDLVVAEPVNLDTDSGPENLNADALRARLKSDPRYTTKPRNMSADYDRHKTPTVTAANSRRLYSDNPSLYRNPDEPPLSNKDSGYSGSVNNILEHERFDNVIPEYPPTPSAGLLEVARQSYSKYIHSTTLDSDEVTGRHNIHKPSGDTQDIGGAKYRVDRIPVNRDFQSDRRDFTIPNKPYYDLDPYDRGSRRDVTTPVHNRNSVHAFPAYAKREYVSSHNVKRPESVSSKLGQGQSQGRGFEGAFAISNRSSPQLYSHLYPQPRPDTELQTYI